MAVMWIECNCSLHVLHVHALHSGSPSNVLRSTSSPPARGDRLIGPQAWMSSLLSLLFSECTTAPCKENAARACTFHSGRRHTCPGFQLAHHQQGVTVWLDPKHEWVACSPCCSLVYSCVLHFKENRYFPFHFKCEKTYISVWDKHSQHSDVFGSYM